MDNGIPSCFHSVGIKHSLKARPSQVLIHAFPRVLAFSKVAGCMLINEQVVFSQATVSRNGKDAI